MKFAHYLKEQEYGAPKEWQGKFLKYKALKVSQMLRAYLGALSMPVHALSFVAFQSQGTLHHQRRPTASCSVSTDMLLIQ